MALRFRRSFQLFPGVRLNVSSSGISASIGPPGVTISVNPTGARGTVRMPGTGISASQELLKFDPAGGANSWPDGQNGFLYTPPGTTLNSPLPPMQQIASDATEVLTSASFADAKTIILAARNQQNEVEQSLRAACEELNEIRKELSWRNGSLFRWFYRKRRAELAVQETETAEEVARLVAWQASTRVALTVDVSPAIQKVFGELVRAFDMLRRSNAIWDVTATRGVNRLLERSNASRMIDRKVAKLDFGKSDLIDHDAQALRFENVNGDDLFFYPGISLMPREDGMFALINPNEITAAFRAVRFTEDESIPSDTQVVGVTWAKENKDGSPDKRFRDNYQIPVCLYGEILFSTDSGVAEAYQFSNSEAARAFALAFEQYRRALPTHMESRVA
jgi:hypothetical protein